MDDAILLPKGVEIERNESIDTYRVRNCPTDELTSTVVVATIGAISGTDPVDLEPLRESVDPDALDSLFRQTPGGSVRDAGRIEFSFADHRVVVSATGEIRVSPQR